MALRLADWRHKNALPVRPMNYWSFYERPDLAQRAIGAMILLTYKHGMRASRPAVT